MDSVGWETMTVQYLGKYRIFRLKPFVLILHTMQWPVRTKSKHIKGRSGHCVGWLVGEVFPSERSGPGVKFSEKNVKKKIIITTTTNIPNGHLQDWSSPNDPASQRPPKT